MTQSMRARFCCLILRDIKCVDCIRRSLHSCRIHIVFTCGNHLHATQSKDLSRHIFADIIGVLCFHFFLRDRFCGISLITGSLDIPTGSQSSLICATSIEIYTPGTTLGYFSYGVPNFVLVYVFCVGQDR
jgi:hypothetical protein